MCWRLRFPELAQQAASGLGVSAAAAYRLFASQKCQGSAQPGFARGRFPRGSLVATLGLRPE